MEIIIYKSIAVCCGVALVILAWRLLNTVWLRPRKAEKWLRQQGLKGNPYKLLYGDLKEMNKMITEAKSRPISLSDDPVPRVFPFIHELIKIYGKSFFTWLGPFPVLHIMDPDLVKEISNKIYQFQKPRGGNPLIKLLVRGLVDTEGEQWDKHRRIINPAFQVEKLKHMLPAFYTSCSEMIGKLERVVPKGDACELDVWPILEALSADVISRTAFGSSYEAGRRIFELQKEQAVLTRQAIQSIYIPGLRFLPTKRNKRMKEIYKQAKASIRVIIDTRLKAMEAGEASNDDLLGILLESNNQEIQQKGNKNSGMSIEEIIEECKLFYFAGQETVAVLLLWTMVLLSQHPLWQVRAREEVFQVFGNGKPDLDGLNHLKIVTMILHEVLRLYPPVASLLRMIHEETKLGDITLPAESLISLHTMLMHHDHEMWGDDAKEFKPERFSEGVSKVTKGRVFYFPFNWGPRICIGQNFAMFEAKMAVSMILQHFCFTLSPSYSHAPYNVITLQPQYGAHLILRRI